MGWVHGVKLYHEIVMPPVPLVSNSSNNIYNGLFSHPMTAPIIALVEKLLNAASARLWMHETDGHLANEKLINWRVLQEKRGEPSCSMQKHTVKSYCILY